MPAVGLGIANVVQTIYRRGYEAEGGQRNDTRKDRLSLHQDASEEQGDKHKEVFHPLAKSYQFQNILHIVFLFRINARACCSIHANGRLMAIQPNAFAQ